MQERFVAGQKLPDEAAASEGYQSFVRIQMHSAEKDLATRWSSRAPAQPHCLPPLPSPRTWRGSIA